MSFKIGDEVIATNVSSLGMGIVVEVNYPNVNVKFYNYDYSYSVVPSHYCKHYVLRKATKLDRALK